MKKEKDCECQHLDRYPDFKIEKDMKNVKCVKCGRKITSPEPCPLPIINLFREKFPAFSASQEETYPLIEQFILEELAGQRKEVAEELRRSLLRARPLAESIENIIKLLT